jgi:hypothetical protein
MLRFGESAADMGTSQFMHVLNYFHTAQDWQMKLHQERI